MMTARAVFRLATSALAMLCAATRDSSAQPVPKSQLASVVQQVAGTRIEVQYRRPVARGRALFGALVPWGKTWTPSADSAARFTTSTAVTVNGVSLAAGSYGVWAIPDSTSWTVIFSSVSSVFHTRYPQGADVRRVRARPHQGDHTESLLFSFPMVDADSTVLQLRWGTTVIPLMIRASADAPR